jgi:S1-C subfamily serine protease
MTRSPIPAALVLALAGAAFAPAASAQQAQTPAAAETGAAYKRILDAVGPALVTVKCVLKMEGGMGGDNGRDMEATGLMMEPTGLVLVSNAKMGGLAARMGISVNPTDIKVLIGDDTEGLKARILARDSELDLCWIKIEDDKASGKTFQAVDFAAGAPTNLGDRLFTVSRMGKFFDHALSVEEGRHAGTTRKPRPLVITGGFATDMRSAVGTPVFNADAKIVGWNIVQVPDKEDMEGGEQGEGNTGVLLLPAAEVVKATARGKEAAKNPPAEEPRKDDAKPAEKPASSGSPTGDKPAEPKKP